LKIVEIAQIWFNRNSIFGAAASKSIMASQFLNLSRRTLALLSFLVVAIVIGVLIYIEQIAILYVLATLSIVALLLIVAFSDLENVGRDKLEGK